MDYKINWDCSEGVFAVPDAAAEGLKLASGKAVKVLIYFMKYRCAPQCPEDIGVTSEDVEDALSYWEQLGVLKKADEVGKTVQKAANTSAVMVQEPVQPVKMQLPSLTRLLMKMMIHLLLQALLELELPLPLLLQV